MSLAGLLSVIAEDPQLRRALDQGDGDADLVAPPALRPFLAAALAQPPGLAEPRFVLAVTATAREAEDLTGALGSLLPPRPGGLLPGLGDAAARAAVAALGHLRPAAGRAAPAGPSRSGQPAGRPGHRAGHPGPQPAPADGRRARRPEPVALRAGQAADFDRTS